MRVPRGFLADHTGPAAMPLAVTLVIWFF